MENVFANKSSLEIYLKTLNHSDLLSFEEEQELAKKIASGDKAARNTLIEKNLRLVVSIAKSYKLQTSIPLEDLIQEGNIGLMKAVDKFDYTQGWRFSTYATYWIRQAISRSILEFSRTIRIPVHMIELISKYNQTVKNLEYELGREPEDAEVAEKMQLTEKKINDIKNVVKDPISLQTALGDEEDGTFEDFVADTNIVDPVEELHTKMANEKIFKMLDTLDPREEKVIVRRYGLDGKAPITLEQLGKQMGITRERVRQIEQAGLRKLRNPIRANVLENFLD